MKIVNSWGLLSFKVLLQNCSVHKEHQNQIRKRADEADVSFDALVGDESPTDDITQNLKIDLKIIKKEIVKVKKHGNF